MKNGLVGAHMNKFVFYRTQMFFQKKESPTVMFS